MSIDVKEDRGNYRIIELLQLLEYYRWKLGEIEGPTTREHNSFENEMTVPESEQYFYEELERVTQEIEELKLRLQQST